MLNKTINDTQLTVDGDGRVALDSIQQIGSNDAVDYLEGLHPDYFDRRNKKAIADLGNNMDEYELLKNEADGTLTQWLTLNGFMYELSVGNYYKNDGKKIKNRIIIKIWWN